MPWDRINQDSDRKVFTHPSAPGWSVEEPYEGYSDQNLIINAPKQGHRWHMDGRIEIEIDDKDLSVFGSDGYGDSRAKTVFIPMVIVCAIVDWMRENNKL